MSKLLKEIYVDIKQTEYALYGKADWITQWIYDYSYIDGAHHKQWLIDQILRINLGTKVIVKLAKFDSGIEEYRFSLDLPSQEYLKWCIENDWEKEECGIAP